MSDQVVILDDFGNDVDSAAIGPQDSSQDIKAVLEPGPQGHSGRRSRPGQTFTKCEMWTHFKFVFFSGNFINTICGSQRFRPRTHYWPNSSLRKPNLTKNFF